MLVGAMIVEPTDEVLAITSGGVVIRTPIEEIRETTRDTLGVRLVNLDEGTSVVSIALVRDVPAGIEQAETPGEEVAP